MNKHLVLLASALFCSGSALGQVSVIIPEFVKSPQVFAPGYSVGVYLDDLDADGVPDAVISNYGESLILMNDGSGQFTESRQIPSIHGIEAGDIDLDGDVDLVTTPSRLETSQIYLNSGSGVFEKADHEIGRKEQDMMFVRLVDLDNDGDLDAVTERVTGQCAAWINDGKGYFSEGRFEIPRDASFCDLNGDGYVDILTRESRMELTFGEEDLSWTQRDGEIGFRVYLNDTKGNFESIAFIPAPDLTRGQHTWNWFADIDNDGDMDVICTDFGISNAMILQNNGAGRLLLGQKLASVEYGRIGTGDLNNDGYVDLVITNRYQPAEVWMNDGKGGFFDSAIRLEERFFSQGCAVNDVDNDGDLDVFVTFYNTGNHGIWLNQLVENEDR